MRAMRLIKWPLVAGAGALLAYLFDPKGGKARRTEARDRAVARARRATRGGKARLRYAEGRLEGAAARAAGAGHFTPESDVDLREHLHQVIKGFDFPTSDVVVDAVDGTVTLRGQVRTPEQVRTVRDEVAKVTGVEKVESYLHLPGTPAPNKADAVFAR